MKRHIFRDLFRSLGSPARLRYGLAVLRQLGGVTPRECSLCGYQGLFQAFGQPPRYDALCPRCGSRERQRLFGLLLRATPGLGAGARIVHFAPEPLIARELKARAADYRSADPHMPGCDLRLDIEALDLPDASVDLFVLNHVIEHVDDAKALAELHRCLVAGGTAVISTPVVEGWRETYEDPGIAQGEDEQARILHFGWPGHLRWYGADLRERIRAAGFELAEFTAGGADAVRYALTRGETIFLARKSVR